MWLVSKIDKFISHFKKHKITQISIKYEYLDYPQVTEVQNLKENCLFWTSKNHGFSKKISCS